MSAVWTAAEELGLEVGGTAEVLEGDGGVEVILLFEHDMNELKSKRLINIKKVDITLFVFSDKVF